MSTTEGFAERLSQERREKAARDKRDLGQKEIAEAVGASEASMSRWEAGDGMPREGMIQALADYFGVTPAWLRYGIEPRTLPSTKRVHPTTPKAEAKKRA